MNIKFDAAQLTKERLFALALPKRVRSKVWTRIRVVSLSAERNIKLRMPVDTGRARASWGHSGGGRMRDERGRFVSGSSQSFAGGADESIWQEDEANLTLTQGSRVEYIEYLNQGSSQQAPAGFIDAEEARAVQQLLDSMGDDIEALFR